MTETFKHTNSQAKFPAERVTESAAKHSCEENPQVDVMGPVAPPDTLLCYHKTTNTGKCLPMFRLKPGRCVPS